MITPDKAAPGKKKSAASDPGIPKVEPEDAIITNTDGAHKITNNDEAIPEVNDVGENKLISETHVGLNIDSQITNTPDETEPAAE